MPIYIPDRIKAPGDFPTLDANDNQIRGFGFFDDATERSALKSNLRCQGYLAFMKDSTQFKQYDSASEADADWENDSNWVLIEGQQTDTYWALDSVGGSAIYYSNPVWIGSSLYAGSEQLYVNGDTKISGALEATTSVKTPIVQSDTSLVLGIDALNVGTPSSIILEWKYGTTRFFSASPYESLPEFVFGNQLKNWDFRFQTLSGNADFYHEVPSGVNPGFQFKGTVDGVEVDGKFVANLSDGNPRFSFDNDARKIVFAPEGYKIYTSVDADVNVLNGVEILLPDPDTGDMHFKNVAQKNFLFSTNTGSGSPTEILEMKPDLVVSNVRLAVGLSSADYGNLEVANRVLVDIGTNTLPYWAYNMRAADDFIVGAVGISGYNNVLIGGFNNGAVQIAKHNNDVIAHFNETGVGIGTTTPSYKLDVDGSGNFLGNVNVGTADSALTGIYLRRTDGNLMGGIRTNDNNTVIIGGFNNDKVQIARHVADEALDDEVMAHFSIGGVGIGTTSPSQKLHVVGRMYLVDANSNTLIGSSWSNITTGSGNVSLGEGALGAVTTGVENVAIGRQSLRDNQAGNRNVAIGYQALQETNNGFNVAIGYQSLYSDTESTGNTAVGFESARNSSGDYMVAVGYSALKDSTGSFNVGVGYEAGKDAGSNSVSIGYRAGAKSSDVVIGHEASSLSTGDFNVIVGRRAGQKSAISNVMIGHEAGRYTASGTNTIVGYQAYMGVDGSSTVGSTTAIGYQALNGLTTGGNNTAIGYRALLSLTTGASNTAVGYESQENFTGSQSVAVGYRAARGATGSHTAIGYLAGQTNAGGTYVGYASASGSTVSATVIGQENYRNVKTGGGDIAIGYLTMYSDKANKVGGSNLMIGNSASYYAGSDTYNTVLGHQALRGTDEGAAAGYLSRDYNVVVGERAMYRAYSGANKNIVIGYQAGYSQQLATDAGDLSTVTFANNVFIGYQSAYDITSGSQNVAIGEQSAYELTEGYSNVILGYKAGLNLTTGYGNVLLGFGAGGQLTTESERLYIANVNTTTPLIYGDFDLGRVGVGYGEDDRNAFGHAFCVSPDMIVGKRGFSNPAPVAGKLWVVSSNSTQGEMGFSSQYNILAAGFRSYPEDLDNYARDLRMYTKSDSANSNEGVERLRITGDGNVGIGETSPDTKLHVTSSQVNSKLLTIENIADANWGGGLILKWANADGTNPYSLDIGAYNQSGQQMRLKFTGLSERVSFSGAPGYQFDKEVIPGSGAGDGGIASAYHAHLYFRLRGNNGNNGYDPTNMYFKAEGGTGTSNISGNLMIMKGDGDIEVPNGDLEISDNSNGLILKDTVTSTRYRVQITSGAITLTSL